MFKRLSTTSGDGGVLTVGAFGSSPNSAGASISGTVLTLQPASATQPGGVTTGAQTYTGIKTFASQIGSTVASGSDFLKVLDGARLNFSTADASAYLYRSAANTVRTPGALTVDGLLTGSTSTFSGLQSSTVASGSNFIKALDGARLSLSTADTNAYLYRSTTDTIRTPGILVVDSMIGIGVAPPVFPLHVVGSAASSLIAGVIAATDASSSAYMGVGNSASKGLAMYAVGTSAPAIQGTSVPYRDYGVLRSSSTANGLVVLNGNPTGRISFAGTSNVNSDAVEFAQFTSTGDFAVDTNVLLVDAANNRVGINKTVPTVPLDVVGAMNITGAVTSSVASGSNALTIAAGATIAIGNSTSLASPSTNIWNFGATSNVQGGSFLIANAGQLRTNSNNNTANVAGFQLKTFTTDTASTVAVDLSTAYAIATNQNTMRLLRCRTAVDTTPVDVLNIYGNGKLGFPTAQTFSCAGTATLVLGTVTINTTAVTAASQIFLTHNTPSGVIGILSAPTGSIVANTSFVINSSLATDVSTVNWFILN